MESYLTPSETQQFSLEIKRSRFISTVAHIDSREQAKAFIASIHLKYPDARHNCWAFIAGAPNDLYGVDQSDDGEPKDTAGKPMLNVLQHSGLGHVVLVVTRYFGGIKLGAGGLVRAYSQSASEAVKGLKTRKHIVCKVMHVLVPYHFLGKIEYYLQKHSIEIIEKNFNNDVALSIAVPVMQVGTLSNELNGLSNGVIQIVRE